MQIHTLSFIFSITATDTKLHLREYETTITIQHNDAKVTHYKQALDVLFLYKKFYVWTSTICQLYDDVIDKMAYTTVTAAMQKDWRDSVYWSTGWH